MPFIICVCIWLAAFLPRMRLEPKETKDWLRSVLSTTFAPLYITTLASFRKIAVFSFWLGSPHYG
uniref:Secreted protein n=1 Tax=Mesocestoides corti TaxID=53468 RepID=A0A5K3FCZ4_MESCO